MAKIVIAGGSGFLGRTLARWHAARGDQVVVLSRRAVGVPGARVVRWDGRELGEWTRELEGVDALINLVGRSVNCRYHERNRRAILDSRMQSTRVLGEAVRACSVPSPVWLNSSTATIYKHTYGEPHGESGGVIAGTPEAKDEFSVEVAQAWEEEFAQAEVPHTRKVVLRTAMVFGNEPGGVYEVLRRLTRFGLGGKMAHGRQWVSWVQAEDFCRALAWLTETSSATGVYNVCAPAPLSNADMMATLRRVHRMPIGLPAARWMLEVGTFLLRTESELVIKSRRVVPERLLAEGFEFGFPDLDSALRSLEE